MKVSYKCLQTYFKEPLPAPDALAELFTFHSFEVEGVEKTAHDDAIIDAKILPDRAHYCLSHAGIAEEASILTKIPFGKNDGSAKEPDLSIEKKPTIRIDADHFCRRYVSRLVENISVDASPDWMKNFLEPIGGRSINAIVDATNFVMFDVGQPLHAFDADKVVGTIIVRAAKEGEKIVLLGGSGGEAKEVVLTEGDHVIADDNGPLAIAGVKGGKRAEVTGATKRIIIESANFEPSAVRRTSTRLALRNESSKRFENEITPELAMAGIKAVSSLIATFSPDARFGPVVDIYPIKAIQNRISVSPDYISQRLGVTVPIETVRDILRRMSISIEEKTNDANAASDWSLTIPYHRLDLTIPDDIVEEIGRIYGYKHIAGILPEVPSGPAFLPKVLREYYLVESVRDLLVNEGFSEASLYTFAPKGDIEIAYPLASDKSALRTSLIPALTESLAVNARNGDLLGLDAIKLFEIGKIFNKSADKNSAGESMVKETLALVVGATQVKKIKGVNGETIVRDALKKIADFLGIKDIELRAEFKGSVFDIDLGSYADKVAVPDSYSSVMNAEVFKTAVDVPLKYKKISPFPFIVRDIAVFVPDNVSESDVWFEIEKGIADVDAGILLAQYSLFDTFKKDGKTSFAFRMVFQAPDRTLVDADAAKVMDAIYVRMKAQNWEVR